MIAGTALIGWLHISRMATSAPDEAVYPAMLLLALAAIVLQYARRQVWVSRGMLAGAVVLMGVGSAVSTNAGADCDDLSSERCIGGGSGGVRRAASVVDQSDGNA